MLCVPSIKNFASRRRQDLETTIEMMWVEIILKNKSILVATIYLSTKSTIKVVKLFEKSVLNVIDKVKDNDSILILGDCNMTDLKWKQSDNPFSKALDEDTLIPASSRFPDILNSFDLKQYNVFPTCVESVLELVITDNLVIQVQLSEKAMTSTHRAHK